MKTRWIKCPQCGLPSTSERLYNYRRSKSEEPDPTLARLRIEADAKADGKAAKAWAKYLVNEKGIYDRMLKEPLIDAIEEAVCRFPELRLGQIMALAMEAAGDMDLFSITDADLRRAVRNLKEEEVYANVGTD